MNVWPDRLISGIEAVFDSQELVFQLVEPTTTNTWRPNDSLPSGDNELPECAVLVNLAVKTKKEQIRPPSVSILHVHNEQLQDVRIP